MLVIGGGPGFMIIVILLIQLFTAPFEKGATLKGVVSELLQTVGMFFVATAYVWISILALTVVACVALMLMSGLPTPGGRYSG